MSELEPLWPHQVAFVDWAAPRSAVLFHGGMRVGKTRSTIEILRRWRSTRSLIACPKKVIPVWEAQFRRFDRSGARVLALDDRGTAKEKLAAAEMHLQATPPEVPAVVVVNYETAWREPLAKWLARQRWDALVLDESQKLKAPMGVAARFFAKLGPRARRRLGLSGTPMPHSPLDIFAQMRVLDPRVLGWSWVAFRAQYAVMGGFEGHEIVGYRDLDALARKTGALTFHVSRDVLKLVPATHTTVRVRLGRKAAAAYVAMERDLVAEVEAGTVTAANGLVKLLRLQQITGGHAPVDRDDGTTTPTSIDSSKRDALVELLEDADKGDRFVVGARFTADLASAHAAAAACDPPRRSFELSGSRNTLAEWRATPGAVLAVQIQAGGLGIDLSEACYCVMYSTGFSLGDYEQFLARVHGPDQKRPVGYYHLVAADTVDEKVYAALDRRREVVGRVLDMMRNKEATNAAR